MGAIILTTDGGSKHASMFQSDCRHIQELVCKGGAEKECNEMAPKV